MDREALRQFRQFKRLNQTQLAKLLGVTQATVSKWETGGEPIPPEVTPERLQALEMPQDHVTPRESSAGAHARRAGETKARILELAMQARYVEGVGMVLSPPQPERGWYEGLPHWALDLRGTPPDWIKENVRKVREAQAGLDLPALPESAVTWSETGSLNGVTYDSSGWHRADGTSIDQAPADEVVHSTAGGQLPAAVARELLASHAQGRAPDYAQAHIDIEKARSVSARPAPIPYDDWRKASEHLSKNEGFSKNGVLSLPSRAK